MMVLKCVFKSNNIEQIQKSYEPFSQSFQIKYSYLSKVLKPTRKIVCLLFTSVLYEASCSATIFPLQIVCYTLRSSISIKELLVKGHRAQCESRGHINPLWFISQRVPQHSFL